ncbi:MAG: TM0106 family RecB-like putative nuclease [Alphaproteobacteria bacterium]
MTWITASDVHSLNHCPRRLWFEKNPPEGLEEAEEDAFEALVIDMGLEHEKRTLSELAKDREVITATSVEHTKQLMDENVSVIYQAQLRDENELFIGNPDFLIRLEDGLYQAADAKLARRVDKEIAIQLAFYRRLLANPHPAIAFVGNGETEEVSDESNPDLNEYIIGIRSVLAEDEPPLVRYSESKCKVCPFNGVCKPEFEEKQELTLVYGIDKRNVNGLEQAGIQTITDLSQTDPENIPDIPYLKGFEKKNKAVLQAKAWVTGEMFKLKDIDLPKGTWVHFDIETNPLADTGEDHVYLWGFLKPGYDQSDFEYVWTDTEAHDKNGWRAFLDLVKHYRDQWPDLRLIHYSNYERQKIQEYSKRYDMEGDDLVLWLLDKDDGPLYDLQKPVKDCLVLPVSGYGLKPICKHKGLVDFQWEDDDSGSQWSVVQYVAFLRESERETKDVIKNSILTYNRDDVVATRKLEEWLRQLS